MKLCKLKISKALQEVGYDEACMDYYLHGKLNGKCKDGSYYAFGLWEDFNAIGRDDLQTDLFSAPRLDDAAYWIRDKHGIVINVSYADFYDPDEWFLFLLNKSDCTTLFCKLECFKTYEDALEAGVIEALEIIKNRQHENNKI